VVPTSTLAFATWPILWARGRGRCGLARGDGALSAAAVPQACIRASHPTRPAAAGAFSCVRMWGCRGTTPALGVDRSS
jgi:hypothetical protein